MANGMKDKMTLSAWGPLPFALPDYGSLITDILPLGVCFPNQELPKLQLREGQIHVQILGDGRAGVSYRFADGK